MVKIDGQQPIQQSAINSGAVKKDSLFGKPKTDVDGTNTKDLENIILGNKTLADLNITNVGAAAVGDVDSSAYIPSKAQLDEAIEAGTKGIGNDVASIAFEADIVNAGLSQVLFL